MKEALKRDETCSEIKGVRDTLQQQKDAEIHTFVIARIYSLVFQYEKLGFGCSVVKCTIVADLFEKFYSVVYDHTKRTSYKNKDK